MPEGKAQVQELRKRLDRWEKRGARSYLLEMWRYGLLRHERATRAMPVGDGNVVDAIPYVPEELRELCSGLDQKSWVLDLGCLGGYGLYDFVKARAGAAETIPKVVGLDIDAGSIEMGRDLAEVWARNSLVRFCLGDSMNLPFAAGSCDLVIARLLLPYVRVIETLGEICRVLKPGASVILQIHSFSYYWSQSVRHIREPRRAFYYLRSILNGALALMTNRQPRYRWFSEIALSRSRLRRWCRGVDLEFVRETSSDKRRPVEVYRRCDTAQASSLQ